VCKSGAGGGAVLRGAQQQLKQRVSAVPLRRGACHAALTMTKSHVRVRCCMYKYYMFC
jgi:hypothetical protein